MLKLLLLMLLQLMQQRTSLCFSHFPLLRTVISARCGILTLKCVGKKSQIDLATTDSDNPESISAASSDFNEDDTLEYQFDSLAEEVTEEDSGLPKCYVIISNLQSGSNIGSICRNALAFNVHEVVVVGRKGFRDKMRNADRGAKRRQTFVHFNSVAEAATYLKEMRNCSIIGVEILDSAVSSLRYVLSPSRYLNPSAQNICH
jgi:tRNA G18 (ribose-2'-O)-methylase SpoU